MRRKQSVRMVTDDKMVPRSQRAAEGKMEGRIDAEGHPGASMGAFGVEEMSGS